MLEGARALLTEGRVRYVYAECVFSPNSQMPHTSFFDLHRVLDALGFCFVTAYPIHFSLPLGCTMANVLYALRSRLPASVPGTLNSMSGTGAT